MIVRRGYSVPEHVTVAGAAAGTVALLYPFLMAHTGDRGVPCPLRTLTGVPCPCCGMTTATVSLVHGGWLAAARTSPAACLLGALVLSTAPLLLARLAGWMPPPRPWSAGARRRTGQVMAGLAAAGPGASAGRTGGGSAGSPPVWGLALAGRARYIRLHVRTGGCP